MHQEHIKTEEECFMEFWKPKGSVGAHISQFKLCQVLSKKGLKKLSEVSEAGAYKVIRVQGDHYQDMSSEDVRDLLINTAIDIADDPANEVMMSDVEPLLDQLAETGLNHTTLDKLSTLPAANDSEFEQKTPDKATFVFDNCAVVADGATVRVVNRAELGFVIDGSKVVSRSFEYTKDKGDFEQFVRKSCFYGHGKPDELKFDQASFDSIRSSLGYLLHPFRDPAEPKVIVLADQLDEWSADDDGSGLAGAHGGSGKSLMLDSLKYLVGVFTKDGKQLQASDRFMFSGVSVSHDVVVLDDLAKNFRIESLFSAISGGFETEMKYQNRVRIDAEKAPKIALSVNHTVDGVGNSYKRRLHTHQVGSYWSRVQQEGGAVHEYLSKGRLFGPGWDGDEWNRFYSFLLDCVNYYIAKGLVTAREEEQVFAGAMQAVGSRDVATWIRDEVLFNWRKYVHLNDSRGIANRDLHENFTRWCKAVDLSFKGWDRRKLTIAIKTVAEMMGYTVNRGFKRNQIRIDGVQTDCIRILPADFNEDDLKPESVEHVSPDSFGSMDDVADVEEGVSAH